MLALSPRQIETLIYPVGFYRTKARVILGICRDLLERFGGRVPDEIDALLTLKGVGRKTANLVVTMGYGKPGICVDTCHLFAAGYDVRSDAGYRQALGECREAVGLERVLAFHLNDARAPLDSGLDRHEHIGRGYLGRLPFRRLLRDRRFRQVPKVLETPKEPEPVADRRNLALLRALRRRG